MIKNTACVTVTRINPPKRHFVEEPILSAITPANGEAMNFITYVLPMATNETRAIDILNTSVMYGLR